MRVTTAEGSMLNEAARYRQERSKYMNIHCGMYTCVCMCVYTCACTLQYTCVPMLACTCVCVCVCVHRYVRSRCDRHYGDTITNTTSRTR